MDAASASKNAISVLTRLFLSALKAAVLIAGLICMGCVTTTGYRINPAPPNLPQNARVLLMPIDVQLFELTAGGLEEPKADWTEAAENHVYAALEYVIQLKQDTLIPYQPPPYDPEKARANDQLMKLHAVVGQSITVHTYFSGYNLPTKKDTFDWSLGDGVKHINERYDADAALFIFIRDSYASAGRKAAMVVGALMGGFYVAGGRQVGFSSLVDLRNGKILWFGRLLRETGDLRTPGPAREAVVQLLAGIPL